jgi:hypothetical protein
MKSDIDNKFSCQIRNLREKHIDFESKTAFNWTYERLKKTAPYLSPENPLKCDSTHWVKRNNDSIDGQSFSP